MDCKIKYKREKKKLIGNTYCHGVLVQLKAANFNFRGNNFIIELCEVSPGI